jgi:gamma-glutamylcyclotransferase (GGCT)/AIG2-like uncharacterized protein YtfP
MPRIFVYGSLKRGCHNFHHLAGQRFLGEASTTQGYRLYDLGSYPGMVTDVTDNEGVRGEIWEVDADTLARLDEFEGVDEGLYRRAPVDLNAPFNLQEITTYLYARDPGQRPVGPTWRED